MGEVPDWSRRRPSAGCWNDGSIASALRKSAIAPAAGLLQAANGDFFGTTFLKYNSAAGAFYGPSGTPHFSQTLAVHSVSHLVYGANFVTRNSLQIPPHGAPSNFDYGYPAQQLAAAFDYNGAYNAGYLGTGITIGVIGTGPISSADYPA